MGYGTEKSLLALVNDLYLSIDKGHASFLLLFDLSAAINTIDHTILLRHLEVAVGIRDA